MTSKSATKVSASPRKTLTSRCWVTMLCFPFVPVPSWKHRVLSS